MNHTFEQARDIMTSMVKTAWDTTTYTLIYDDLPGNIPTTSNPWARLTIRHNQSQQASLAGDGGTKRFRRQGVLMVQIFATSGKGLLSSDILSKVIVDAFEGKSSNGIWFRNVSMNEVGQDGHWFQTNVSVDFEYDEIK